MTWDAYNSRKAALHDVLAVADRRREDVTATELLADIETARLAFGNEVELLLDTQMIWFQALSGRMDQMLTFGADDLEGGAVNAWHHVAQAMPGARALLDPHDSLDDLRIAFDKEHEFLARAAGVPANHPDLADHGARIKDLARTTVVYEPFMAPREGNFFSRMRGLRAA